MKKAEFLTQENVPQFIKDLVALAPDDAEVDFMSLGLPVPGAKPADHSCECNDCKGEYEEGINIFAYLDSLGSSLTELMEMTDCKGNISKKDVDKAAGYVDVMSGTISQLFKFLGYE